MKKTNNPAKERADIAEKILLLRKEKHLFEERYHALAKNKTETHLNKNVLLKKYLHNMPFEMWTKLFDDSINGLQAKLDLHDYKWRQKRAFAMMIGLILLCILALFSNFNMSGLLISQNVNESERIFFVIPFFCISLLISFTILFVTKKKQ